MVRFIDDTTVLINWYFKDYKEFLQGLTKSFLNHKINIEVLDLKATRMTKTNWAYINFLQTEDRIIVRHFQSRRMNMRCNKFTNTFPHITRMRLCLLMPLSLLNSTELLIVPHGDKTNKKASMLITSNTFKVFESSMSEITVYVLPLEDGYFYVGKTRNPDRRILSHSIGEGSVWTTKHKFVSLYQSYVFEVKTLKDEDKWENFITIKLMKEKGWKMVRGGYWCNIDELETLKGLQHHGYFIDIFTEEACTKERKCILYSLELENGKFFVGRTKNLKKSLQRHECGKASEWTFFNKPLAIIETIDVKFIDEDDIKNKTDEMVLRYFEEYGYENVRGGRFSCIDDDDHVALIKKKIKSNYHKLYSPKLLLSLLNKTNFNKSENFNL